MPAAFLRLLCLLVQLAAKGSNSRVQALDLHYLHRVSGQEAESSASRLITYH